MIHVQCVPRKLHTNHNNLHVHTCIHFCTLYSQCMKIYNVFLQALETCRKACLWQAFLVCFVASVHKFYFTEREHISCISFNFKSPKHLKILVKRPETRVIPIIFNVVLCHVQAKLLLFITICSTWIRYQEIIICILRQLDE